MELVAFVDWLLVLYGASDVLHNDIDVGGIDLDNSFVPEIFYSHDREEKESEFSAEQADYKLGIGLEVQDEVNSSEENYNNWEDLDQSFHLDLGFSFTGFITVIVSLSQWQSIQGERESFFSYNATADVVIDTLFANIKGFSKEEVRKIIEFLTLKPNEVRMLIGKTIPEGGVPIWEHNKRDARYTIKPLIPIGGKLYWGAGAAERTYRVWTGAIAEGYLPASFEWANVKRNVDSIKKRLEDQLEARSNEVCQRFTPYVINIDFKRRFPKESFDDAGDFDVLAYWPNENRWLMIECKYNKPPFCLKDARRLRKEIFGKGNDRRHISKIERRHKFLNANTDKILSLLNWPRPEENTQKIIIEGYVSREI